MKIYCKWFSTCLLLLMTTSLYAEKAPITDGEPVVVNQDTLFRFYCGQGLFNTKERALVVTERIQRLMNRLDFSADSLQLKNDSPASVIYYGKQIILAISDRDAALSKTTRQQMATDYLTLLKTKLSSLFETGNIKDLVTNLAEAAAVVAILFLLIWAVNRLFRSIRFKILNAWESRINKLSQKGAPVRYAHRLLPFISKALFVARVIIIILLVYLSLPALFLIFPWTKPIATELLGYVIKPLKAALLSIVHYIPNLLTISVIFLITHYVIRVVKFFADEIEKGSFSINNFYPEWASPTYNIIRVLLYAFMFIIVFPYLPGSESKVFQGVTVFVGVLVSFGSSSAISNMVAGIVLTYMRAFKIGDRIQAGEIIGDVFEKNMLVTRIRTIKNEDVTLPNSKILGGHTVNYSSSAKTIGLILHTSVTIGYDAQWHTIHELLINAALNTEGIIHEPKPFVLQTALNDFNVTYQVNAYTHQPNKMAATYSLLHQHIQDKFNEAGVEIMSPHYTSLRDGNAIQIPDDYIAKGYKKPGFKVE